MKIDENGLTMVTSEDLPELRRDICGYADNPILSGTLRTVCRNTVAAIDIAIAADLATHAALQTALANFAAECKRELRSRDERTWSGSC